MRIVEVLTSPVNYKWEEIPSIRQSRSGSAVFSINNKTYTAVVEPAGGDDWEFSFAITEENNLPVSKIAITGTGHSYVVFSTILAILFEFLKNIKPVKVWFSAHEPSRIKLYTSLLRVIQNKTNYTTHTEDRNNSKNFVLTHKRISSTNENHSLFSLRIVC